MNICASGIKEKVGLLPWTNKGGEKSRSRVINQWQHEISSEYYIMMIKPTENCDTKGEENGKTQKGGKKESKML